MSFSKKNLIKVNDFIWDIPKNFRKDMRVPGRIFASEDILADILLDQSLEQVVNVATLPGIEKWSLAMPDIHEGYGMAVGGVAAFNFEEGIISPGAVGYDINCGIRVLKSNVFYDEVKDRIPELTASLYREIPSGVGRGGLLRFNRKELDLILSEGVKGMAEMGYANKEDVENCESNGQLGEAEPAKVSEKAKARGRDQLGTLGAGNHFIEVQKVDKIFDEALAKKFNLFESQVVIMIHCGSRGLGHQVATDYIREMLRAVHKYGIYLPDRQLACAPVYSPEGKNYFSAMSAAANFAWANRQMITWKVREVWRKMFNLQQATNNLQLIYDVAHNIAKVEEYDGRKLVVHRKGATRAFPGQPVLIPGSMGTESYILGGSENSLVKSFGSCCHGAGRTMSRSEARKKVSGPGLKRELENLGISVQSGSIAGLSEESPVAYKNVCEVVKTVQEIGLASGVARLKPLGVVKG